MRHYASIRLDMRRVETIKEGDRVIGNRIRAIVKKNKLAPPFREAEFDIMFNAGISRMGDVLDLGVTWELIVVERQRIYSYRATMLGKGREEAKRALRDDPTLALEIENRIRKSADLPGLEPLASPTLGWGIAAAS